MTGTIKRRQPERTAVTGVDVTDSLAGASSTAAGGQSTGITVHPANGTVTARTAATRDSQAANNTATATGVARRCRRLRTAATATSRSADADVEVGKTVKAVDGENTWNGIDGHDVVPVRREVRRARARSDERRRTARRQHGDREVRRTRARHGQRERPGRLRHDAAPAGHAAGDAADGRVHGRPGEQGRDAAGAARQRAGGRSRTRCGCGTTARTRRTTSTVADAAPSGVTFVAVTQQPVGGGCSITGGVCCSAASGRSAPVSSG